MDYDELHLPDVEYTWFKTFLLLILLLAFVLLVHPHLQSHSMSGFPIVLDCMIYLGPDNCQCCDVIGTDILFSSIHLIQFRQTILHHSH